MEVYSVYRFAWSQMILEVECVLAELERIGRLKRVGRETLLEIVDQLWGVKERVRWKRGFVRQDAVDLKILAQKLEELWLRRRRMREALMEVGYQLDHIQNKMLLDLIK